MLEEDLLDLLDYIYNLYPHISKKYITYCRMLVELKLNSKFEYFRKEALKLLYTIEKKKDHLEQNKLLPLLHEFDLYGEVSYNKILDFALKYSNTSEILYLFRAGEN